MLYEFHNKVINLERNGKKIVKLNVGDPDFLPPQDAINAGITAIQNREYKYADVRGSLELREKIALKERVDAENVVITPGSKWAVYSILHLLSKQNAGSQGNVLLPAPYWTAFNGIIQENALEPQIIPLELEKNWQLTASEVEKHASVNTRALILNNPHNPTSVVWSEKNVREGTDFCNTHNIPVLFDYAYSDLSFENQSEEKIDLEKNFVTKTFSKLYGMSGWRIGYTICSKEFAARLATLNSITFTCVPIFVQKAALAALGNSRENVVKEFKQRAGLAMKILASHGIACAEPKAGFYVFPRLPCDGLKLANELLEKHSIAITPGAAFGEAYTNYARISLTQSLEVLEVALEKICETASNQ